MSSRPLKFFYCLNNNFQTKDLRRTDRKLISPNAMCPGRDGRMGDVQKKPVFDLCMSQIVTISDRRNLNKFF